MDLSNLQTNDDIAIDNDYVGGFKVLDSGVYHITVELAYVTVSQGGAMALNIVAKTAEGAKLSQQLYMTSGTAKGGKNTYTDKNGAPQYLPGFVAANTLSLLTTGKEIGQLAAEKKVINLYDYDAKKDLPTTVDMFVDLIGMEVKAGVEKQVVDKNAKNDAGVYVPTGETREQNELVKFFRVRDNMSVTEIQAQATEAVYIDVWTDQNEGVTKQKAKGATTGSTPGAPAKAAGANAPKSLFA
jgi:hypothetical protein